MNDDIKRVIGERINSVLLKKNILQKDLAKAIGVTDNTISFYCNGSRVPNHEQLIKIAKFLDVSTDYLLGVSEAMTTNAKIKDICDYTGLNIEMIKALHNRKKIIKPMSINDFLNACIKSKHFFSLLFYLDQYLKNNIDTDDFIEYFNKNVEDEEDKIYDMEDGFFDSMYLIYIQQTLNNMRKDLYNIK